MFERIPAIIPGSGKCKYVVGRLDELLYLPVFAGFDSAVFKAYSDSPPHFTELRGEILESELHFYGKQRRAERFAWLSGSGIYHGHLIESGEFSKVLTHTGIVWTRGAALRSQRTVTTSTIIMEQVRAMGEPGASSSSRRTHEEAMEEKLHDSMDSFSGSLSQPGRNVRRRVEFDFHSVTELTIFPHTLEFVVYLPNRSSVEVRVSMEVCKKLKVQEFVNLVKMELVKMKTKQSRGIVWGDHVELRDFEGNLIGDGEFASSSFESKRILLLYDKHLDTAHAHPGFWNVTPEPHMLEVLPQDYTLFSALADELDNSLQAVYQLQPGMQRLICVDLDHENGKITICDTGKGMDGTPSNCISKWGTLGSSTNRHVLAEAIGGDPPYLKPNFGMYGFGGISAGFHLGGCITVSSKTETSQRVAILHLGRKSLAANVKSGSVWKTGGEFRSPTELELQWSQHGSFTKVEISELNRKVSTWRVEEVQRKLKDYYFPYIQNDEGNGDSITTRPVEIRVNGEDLAGVVGGEVTHTNYHSGPGEPYVILLEFTKPRDMDGPEHAGDSRVDKANARITCHYFPVRQGRESIDEIIDLLKEESDYMGDFETFSRRAIRRLGRLLPDAQGGRLPFMEPKKIFRANEVNRHCFKRVKAFIDVDAGFIPTQSKMDLVPKHPFTEALLNLGLGLQTIDTARVTLKKAGPVAVTIKRWNTEHQAWAPIKPEHLHNDYTTWIKKQHESFDVGALFDENGLVIVTQPQNRKELSITKDVFRVVYGIKCKGIDWKVGKEEPPIHLKFLKGIPGLSSNDKSLFVTVECFISEGLQDDPGDTRIICRPMGIPEERGSQSGMDEEVQLPYFILGESRAFPMEILFTDKHETVPEAAWLKQLEKIQSKLPSFVDLLNEQEVSELTEGANKHHSVLQCTNLKAGASLPEEIFAVVRPSSCNRPGGSKNEALKLEQKKIIAECMEMTLLVRGSKVKGISVEAEKLYQAKTRACTKNNWRGVYCFSTTDTNLESVTRTTGTYEFTFTLVSAKYKEVEDFKLYINVTPSSVIGGWNICNHSGLCNEHHLNRGPKVINMRLGRMLPGALYLNRVDEFSNPMEFTNVPANIKAGIYSLDGEHFIACAVDDDLIQIADEDQYSLQIPRIEVGGGDLAPFKPTMRAELRMSISDSVVASFSVSVLPGEIASARLKESEPPENRLRPGEIIFRLVYEALDKYENPVSAGEKVRLVLEGFGLQDNYKTQQGFFRMMDDDGCLDLGGRLKVTAGYGETARVQLRSTEEELCETTFHIINRTLRVCNDPDQVAVNSQVTGLVVEAIDEQEQLDMSMDGTAHTLTLAWDSNITVPFRQGKCTLPPITMPSTTQLWIGQVSHSEHPELQVNISIFVDKDHVERSEVDTPDPPDISPERSATPASLPQPRACVRRLVAPVVYERPKTFVQPKSLATVDNSQARFQATVDMQAKSQAAIDNMQAMVLAVADNAITALQSKLQKLKKKETSLAKELEGLSTVEKDHKDWMKRYGEECDKLAKAVKLEQDAVREEAHDPIEIFALTPAQVALKVSQLGHPTGTHAAAILLQAQNEHYTEVVKEKGILGIVALLGAVEGEPLNRALVEFLGVENMLAIICSTESAAECMGSPHSAHENNGLLGFIRRQNRRISGRYRVITLTDESKFYKFPNGSRAVNETHPQRLLNIGPVIREGAESSVGSLGYAVNMIHLNDEQLKIRIGGHGLRESLFYMLFGFLEVFDTKENMIRASKNLRFGSAISLDGGLIRAPNQFELGSREDPVVWFPAVDAVKQRSREAAEAAGTSSQTKGKPKALNIEFQRFKEVKAKMDVEKERYAQAGIEHDLRNVTEKLKLIRKKMLALESQLSRASPAPLASRPPGSKY